MAIGLSCMFKMDVGRRNGERQLRVETSAERHRQDSELAWANPSRWRMDNSQAYQTLSPQPQTSPAS